MGIALQEPRGSSPSRTGVAQGCPCYSSVMGASQGLGHYHASTLRPWAPMALAIAVGPFPPQC